MRSREQSHERVGKTAPPADRLRSASALLLFDRGEVYLAQRSAELRFFGGFHAAIGGAVSRVDGGGEDRFAQALLRECFEETGLALFSDAPPSDADRRRLLDDDTHWARIRSAFDCGAPGRPSFRLVTPSFYPRCFDTNFFVVDLNEAGGDRSSFGRLSGELIEGRWASPAEWLESWRRGELLLVPPVVLLFEALVGAETNADTALPEIRRILARAATEIESHPSQPIWNSPLARLVYLRTPTQPPAEHTNTYLVGSDPAYVVDPATPHAAERQTLLRCIAEERERGRRFRAILLTHDHPDHVGAANWLRQQCGWPIWAHRLTQEQLGESLRVDEFLEDGQRLSLGRGASGEPWHLRCVHTPGHARGHLCFVDDHYADLLAGDMVSTLSSILIDPRDGNLGDYERSLEQLIALEPRVVMPAHGPADGRGKRPLQAQLRHRQRRSDEVLRAVEAGAESVAAIVDSVYSEVPAPQRALADRSVVSILRHLHAVGRCPTVGHDLARESGILPSP